MASTLGLLAHVVEKDYVLGWVLAGIYRQTALAESGIFKGGSCFKKCYFETYRFSEDLDLTLTIPSQIDRDFLKHGLTLPLAWCLCCVLRRVYRSTRTGWVNFCQ